MQSNRLALSRRSLLLAAGALALTARHAAAQEPASTPAAAGTFADRIGALMALVPAELVELTESSLNPFTYADLSTQLASVGLSRPVGADLPEGFLAGTEVLPLSHVAYQQALTPAWAETFGFWPLEIDRVLVAGEPPNVVAVFAGIDTERVRRALDAAGYKEVLQEVGGDYLSLGDELDLTTDAGLLGRGGMNQAVVRDGVAIFTREEAMIQRVTQVMAGMAPSILETGGWPALMTTLASDTVGVIAIAPAAFSRSGDPAAIQQAAFGVRAGATNLDLQEARDRGEEPPVPTAVAEVPANRPRVQVRIRYADAETAAVEAEAIPARWESMEALNERPFTELMLVESAGTSDADPTVAAIDFRVTGAAGWWYQLVYRSDFGPFVPQG